MNKKARAVLDEAIRLHRLGFAIHWLRPRSKIPVKSGWTKGPRDSLKTIKADYRPGFNPGVRLGSASPVDGGYLTIVDVDIKSQDPAHYQQAIDRLFTAFPQLKNAPFVLSGRGNGSAHYYGVMETPVSQGCTIDKSLDIVKVRMPSVEPNKKEKATLRPRELDEGVRLRAAWEISLLSEGRQAALPGAIHPDTGSKYIWGKQLTDINDLPLIVWNNTSIPGVELSKRSDGTKIKIDPVETATELYDLGLKDEHVAAILDGVGVHDRSAMVFSLCMTMRLLNVPDAKILGIFTNRDFYLGETAYDHAKTNDKKKAALWIDKYCLSKARMQADKHRTGSVFDTVTEDENQDDWIDPKPSDQPRGRAGEGKVTPPVEKAARGRKNVAIVGIPEDAAWQHDLRIEMQRDGSYKIIKHDLRNLIILLKNMSGSDKPLQRDLFALRDTWLVDTPWGTRRGAERQGNGDDALRIKRWLSDTFEIEPTINLIEEALTCLALEAARHPLRDYLDSLHWDGTPRIDKAFKKYLGAEGSEPYLSAVSRKFFLACVKRAYEPGCKFDHMVVFDGMQGIGKSTFAELLASKKWFLDSLPNFADKDAAVYLQGTWICEISELAALYRSSNESTKAFVSRSVDKFRPPYGRTRQDFPRTTIFLGTVNSDDYLTDHTGNRRFWPVTVRRCNFAALERDRDQLWAEAVFRHFYEPEPLWLTGKAAAQALVYQSLRQAEDETVILVGNFQAWLESEIKEGRDVLEFSIYDLFERGAFSGVNPNMANLKKIAHVLRLAGYSKKHTRSGKIWTARKRDA